MGLQPLTIADLKFLEGKQPTLRIDSWGSTAIIVSVRVLTREGLERIDHTSNADRSFASTSFRLSQLPMIVSVYNVTTPVRRGQVFVRVSLLLAGILMGLLCQGYVYDGQILSWPGGKNEGSLDGPGLLRSVPGTDPAAGAEISETVPTNARWRLRGIQFSLVTDATVADRRVRLNIDDGATLLHRILVNLTQVASLTYEYHFMPTYPSSGVLIGAAVQVYLPLDLMLFQGWRIRTSTVSVQAGDNYGAPQLLVEEWIEE